MSVTISISGPDHLAELGSLEDWLLGDPELRDATITRPAALPRPGQMGAMSDVLVVALGSGGTGAALATALSVWFRTRAQELTVRLQGPEGTALEVSARTTRDLDRLIAAVKSLASGSGAGPG